MGLFRRKNTDFIDLGERHRKQQKRTAPQAYPEIFPTETSTRGKIKQDNESSDSGGFGFFGAIANSVSQNKSYVGLAPKGVPSVDEDINTEGKEKKRKLVKRLMDMTNKIEELTNQIYHLQQRIEVLEKKSGVGGY